MTWWQRLKQWWITYACENHGHKWKSLKADDPWSTIGWTEDECVRCQSFRQETLVMGNVTWSVTVPKERREKIPAGEVGSLNKE